MTYSCAAVMAACDFKPEEARELEVLLTRHSPTQLIKLFWAKDPEGKRRLEWFRPFFERNYVKETVDAGLPGSADELFWRAYEYWNIKILEEDFSTFHLAAIWTMSRDFKRMKQAFVQSRVKLPPYVLKVFEGLQGSLPAPEATKVDFEVGNSGGVKVVDL